MTDNPSDNDQRNARLHIEYEAYIRPLDQQLQGIDRMGTDIAVETIKACSLLNGGGLATVPAIIALTHIPLRVLSGSAALFAAGIVMTLVSWAVAYSTVAKYRQAISVHRESILHEMLGRAWPDTFPKTSDSPLFNKVWRQSRTLHWAGVGASIASALCFTAGAILMGFNIQDVLNRVP